VGGTGVDLGIGGTLTGHGRETIGRRGANAHLGVLRAKHVQVLDADLVYTDIGDPKGEHGQRAPALVVAQSVRARLHRIDAGDTGQSPIAERILARGRKQAHPAIAEAVAPAGLAGVGIRVVIQT
jgi:hypothetical protein